MTEHTAEKDVRSRLTPITVLLSIVAIILIGWALRATYVVSMPLALAAFLAVLLRPLQRFVADHVPPKFKWLGVLAGMAVFVAVLLAFAGVIYLGVELVSGKSDKYVQQIQSLWKAVDDWLASRGYEFQDQFTSTENLGQRAVSVITGGLMSIWSVLALLVVVFFLLLLMLMEAGAWRRKLERVSPPRKEPCILGAVDTIAVKLRRYMLVATGVSASSGIVQGLFLWIMGVDFALMWGFIIFFFNYIPNIGSIVSLGAASALAFLQFGWQWGLAIAAGLTVLDQTIGNFISPRLQGRSLSLSSLVILASILFWGWVWGILGALLAVPIMLALIVGCAHFNSVRGVAVLLAMDVGDDEQFTCAASDTCPPPAG